jgi:uncharacterized protein (DUF1499 family)
MPDWLWPYAKVAGVVILVGVALWALSMIALSLSAKRPDNLGVREGGKLAPCPASPNCVCSQCDGADQAHAVDPLAFSGEPDAAWERLKRVLEAHPRTRITERTEAYLRAECTSLLFRFVDDVELLLDRDARLIHVRSASRVGHSDLGVNRARVEAIRRAFDQGKE